MPSNKMIKDLPEGQTHHENDGCGEPAHNPMPSNIPSEWEVEFNEKFPTIKIAHPDIAFFAKDLVPELKDFIQNLLSLQREKIDAEWKEKIDKILVSDKWDKNGITLEERLLELLI